MRIALGQFNATVGALNDNANRILELAHKAKNEHRADLLVLPEMSLCGYPAQDLWLDKQFITDCQLVRDRLIQQLPDLAVVLGYPGLAGHQAKQTGQSEHQTKQTKQSGKTEQTEQTEQAEQDWREAAGTCTAPIATNQADVFFGGHKLASYAKQTLPNYSVFDEKRYFVPGTESAVFVLNGVCFGLLICEDLWRPEPMADCRAAGAQHVISINASPYHRGQLATRHRLVQERAKEFELPVSYINACGGQDGLVFDGNSFVCDKNGKVVSSLFALGMKEGLLVTDLDEAGDPKPSTGSAKHHIKKAPKTDETGSADLAEVYDALTLGLADYHRKNGFKRAVLGLSGGIDSALTLCIAADALGADKVMALLLPSQYTSSESLRYAQEQVALLGAESREFPIGSVTEALRGTMSEFLKDETDSGTTLQNIQARSRALMLMTWANREDALLLATGNKSEFAVGYSTLYGDMAGGFCPLIDVFKTDVYALARFRNVIGKVIPNFVIDREPSAELYGGQKDSDQLPPYDILDGILRKHLEEGLAEKEIIACGYDEDTVRRVIRMVRFAEHKRFQAAVGTRISLRSYGRDRRYPITNGYNDTRPQPIPQLIEAGPSQ